MYNDRMERAFVVDAVTNAVEQIEQRGRAAFPLFHDPKGPFIAKDAYIFVIDMKGVELVNPAFPNLEGNSLLDVTDTHGKHPIQEMLEVVKTRSSGWVDYMWPKPGESVSTQKSAYVSRAKLEEQSVLVGCGVYLADAPKAARPAGKLTASHLMTLVREGAAALETEGGVQVVPRRHLLLCLDNRRHQGLPCPGPRMGGPEWQRAQGHSGPAHWQDDPGGGCHPVR
jgi:single cache domain-containing protein